LAVALVAVFGYLINNMLTNLRASNIPLGWGFLDNSAGFEIAEGPAFDPAESYWRAFLTGVANTVRVVVAGIVLATVVGLLAGIARLSSNWLVRTLAGIYVETIRNTPLLVQLFFWYFAVIMQLPDIREHLSVGGVAFLSNRGVVLAWPALSATGRPWLIWLGAALALGVTAWLLRRWQLRAQGRLGSGFAAGLIVFLAIAAVGYWIADTQAQIPAGATYELRRGDRGVLFVDADGDGEYTQRVDRPLPYVPITLFSAGGAALGTMETDGGGEYRFDDLAEEGASLTWEAPPPLVFTLPAMQGFNITGGRTFSPEYTALLLGLVLYTGAFIAEIVRGGVNAVPKGQWEASRAVGLSGGDTLRLVILPQALRVIIPPLTSQYLNLAKNSSLAIAIGYPDLFNVSRTIINQAGAAVQMILIIMAAYLVISLLTSLLMNIYNRRVALVER
jgi:general L-amino acid transport system permease protein